MVQYGKLLRRLNQVKTIEDSMKIGDVLQVSIKHSPSLDDHFVIEVENSLEGDVLKEYFTVVDEKLKLRLTPETAIQLAQYIDEKFEEIINKEMQTGV